MLKEFHPKSQSILSNPTNFPIPTPTVQHKRNFFIIDFQQTKKFTGK
jgi:hypothetical protein